MRIKIKSEEIFVYTITNEDYKRSNTQIEDTTKNLSYMRSRYLLKRERLNHRLEKYHYSFSHTENISAIAFSTNQHIGIDIEPVNRKLGENLIKRLRKKGQDLSISEIELWCIMESTFKSKKLKSAQNFLEYDFFVQDKIFFHDVPEGMIASDVRKFENLILSVSLLV